MQDRERITMSARNAFGIAFLLALSLLQFGCSEDSPANNSSNKPANVAFNAADNQNTAGNTYKSASNVSPVPPKCNIKDKLNLIVECPKGESVRMVIEPPDPGSNATVSIDGGPPQVLANKEFVVNKKTRIFIVYHFTPASGSFNTKFLDSGNNTIISRFMDRPSSPKAQPPEHTFVFESK